MPDPANTFLTTAKRLPYCDNLIVLDKTGGIAEKGCFANLNVSGGHVSSFNLARPDRQSAPERHMYEPPPQYIEQQISKHASEEDIQAKVNRRTGDLTTYRYYIDSVGWIPSIIFIVSVTIFVFGILFPSKSYLLKACMKVS